MIITVNKIINASKVKVHLFSIHLVRWWWLDRRSGWGRRGISSWGRVNRVGGIGVRGIICIGWINHYSHNLSIIPCSWTRIRSLIACSKLGIGDTRFFGCTTSSDNWWSSCGGTPGRRGWGWSFRIPDLRWIRLCGGLGFLCRLLLCYDAADDKQDNLRGYISVKGYI
jgi:hypothetical protein